MSVCIPEVDGARCAGCRKCVEFCRFNALAFVKNRPFVFSEVCHFCGGCILLCPNGALTERQRVIGEVESGTSGGVRVLTGVLHTGEVSGVPIVKKLIGQVGGMGDRPVFIDCPPGSACIVMESIREADFCVLAAEPTVFGVSNLAMAYELVRLFDKRYGVVLNKCLDGDNPAERFCIEKGIPILGKIPYDTELGSLSADAEIAAARSDKYHALFVDCSAPSAGRPAYETAPYFERQGRDGQDHRSRGLHPAGGARAYADCDVDAPNLHLVTTKIPLPERRDYYGLPKARINPELCKFCSRCRDHCRFDAIAVTQSAFRVDPFACEGCGVCQAVCPSGAVTMIPAPAGETLLYRGRETVFSTAQLKMGSGTTGKLVTEVKKNLMEAAPEADLAIIDGSPGIGCPVIASMSGVHLVLIVAEPSVSGISDLRRILKTAGTFRVKTAVCVNKYDTNPDNADKIEAFCRDEALPFVGRIPYDVQAVAAVNKALTIADVDCPSGRAVREIYEKTVQLI